MQNLDSKSAISKVPAVTAGFWLIKILATTLGETGGDTVSMSMKLGYLAGTGIFLTVLVALVWAQVRAKRFHPFLYWATIIASTTAGTTLADFATRSLGIGYTGGSALLLAAVLTSLALWRLSLGSISSDHIATPKAELFYWITITLSQTLGTALGDWTADTGGLGYVGAAGCFRRPAGTGRWAGLVDPRQSRPALLGRLYPHPAARRGGRRFSRPSLWITVDWHQPPVGVSGSDRRHPRPHPPPPSKGWSTSWERSGAIAPRINALASLLTNVPVGVRCH